MEHFSPSFFNPNCTGGRQDQRAGSGKVPLRQAARVHQGGGKDTLQGGERQGVGASHQGLHSVLRRQIDKDRKDNQGS